MTFFSKTQLRKTVLRKIWGKIKQRWSRRGCYSGEGGGGTPCQLATMRRRGGQQHRDYSTVTGAVGQGRVAAAHRAAPAQSAVTYPLLGCSTTFHHYRPIFRHSLLGCTQGRRLTKHVKTRDNHWPFSSWCYKLQLRFLRTRPRSTR